MRLKLALVALAVGTTAAPAFAQRYPDGCGGARRENQIAGAVIGGILGGVLGSNVAKSGHRGDGTAVGAVVGALAGSEVGRGGTRCGAGAGYGDPYGNGYGNSYPGGGQPYYGASTQPYPQSPVYAGAPYGGGSYSGSAPYGDRDYGRDYGYDDQNYRSSRRDDDYGGYDDSRGYAGRECAGAKQVTRLPDGTEIHRPVEACREAYYLSLIHI